MYTLHSFGSFSLLERINQGRIVGSGIGADCITGSRSSGGGML